MEKTTMFGKSLFVLGCALCLATPAHAAPVTATYSISIAGIDVGSLDMTVTDKGKSYSFKLSGSYGFLFNNGSFSASASGLLGDGGPTSTAYVQTIKSDDDELTRIKFTDGNATKTTITPPPGPKQTLNRIPLKDEDLLNVMDPLSAILSMAIKAGQSETEMCAGDVPVFTGLVRAKLTLSPANETPLQVLCKVKFTPISGHRNTANVKRIAASDALRVGFPRKSDGKFRLPQSISVPLKFGTLIITRKS
jgi:hypothetical protein